MKSILLFFCLTATVAFSAEPDADGFAITHEEDVASKWGFAKEGIKLLKKSDEGGVDYDADLKSASPSELKKFIQANSLPLVVTFDQGNAQKIFGCLHLLDNNIHKFNRRRLLPRLKSLVTIDYFRYVKVNLNRPCQLWCTADKCSLRDCKVKISSDPYKCPMPIYDNELATVNTNLPSDQLDLLTKLFECNDDDDPDSQYVDLLLNPERFTGYTGEPAHRVWRAIYDENCFMLESDLCYEQRLFYEAISGLHSSINIHLCAEYPSNGLIGEFGPNLEEFMRRFDGHNEYIENLYTLYLLELRALAMSEKFLLERVNWPESSTKDAVKDLLGVVKNFDIPMFEDLFVKPDHVSHTHELATHFRNITTTIMDCVACDKCKLWGKVQLRGLGAAFKILSVKDLDKIVLNHQEIVSLINAIARLSHSIRQLETFRDLFVSKSNKIDRKQLTQTYNSTL